MSNQGGVIERIPGPPEGADIDVVLVHGLGGNALSTWEAKGPGKKTTNWVTDPQFLPALLPKARIFTYGYNANLLGDRVTSRIEDHADGLRAGLLFFRRKCKNRPILWIGHSLGGILIKRALITHDQEYTEYIRDPSRAIIFLGTPHKGSSLAGKPWLPAVRKIVAWAQLRHDVGPLVGELDPYSDTLKDTTKSFSQISLAFTIRSFYEQKPTRLPPPEGDQLIVDSASAVMGIPTEKGIAMSATHEQMCKFSSVDDDNYRILSQQIVDLATLSIDKILEEEANNIKLAERFLNLSAPKTQLFFGNNVTIVNTISTSRGVVEQLQDSSFRETVNGRNLSIAASAMTTELAELDMVLKSTTRILRNNKTVEILNKECQRILEQLNDYISKGSKSRQQATYSFPPPTQVETSGLQTELEGEVRALIELRKAIQDFQSQETSTSTDHLPLPPNRLAANEPNNDSSSSPSPKAIRSMTIAKRLSLFKAAAFNNHNLLLYQYAQIGDLLGAKYILEKSDADPNCIFPHGTPLQAAASNGHRAVIELLIIHGAHINLSAGKYGTALQAAVYWGKTLCVRVLLERGADVDQSGGLFGSALQAAIRIPRWRVEGREEIIKLLVHAGARVTH